MFTRSITERRRPAFFILAALALLLLAGCGSSNTTPAPAVQHSSVITTSAKNSAVATATLKSMPLGNAMLNWNYTDQMLTIQVMLNGLAPSSTHPVQIVQGSCDSQGKTLYPLLNLIADAHGMANGSSKIAVPKGIPEAGWSLNIYNGPELSTAEQSLPLVCGNITNPDTSLRSAQSVQVALVSSPAKGQDASGTTQLRIVGHTLTVKMTVIGLEPNSEHMAHIHSGTCLSQGPVVYTLPVIKADASGKATITATFQNVPNIPANGWYVNVHRGTDLSTQTGFDPIACGNVVLS